MGSWWGSLDPRSWFEFVLVQIPLWIQIPLGCFRWVSNLGYFQVRATPNVCHYCGLLGHDLCHCASYFERKKSEEVGEFQYGNWLRANSGCPWSSTQRHTPRYKKNEHEDGYKDGPLRTDWIQFVLSTANVRTAGVWDDAIVKNLGVGQRSEQGRSFIIADLMPKF